MCTAHLKDMKNLDHWTDRQLDLFSWWRGNLKWFSAMSHEEYKNFFDEYSNQKDYIRLHLNGEWTDDN